MANKNLSQSLNRLINTEIGSSFLKLFSSSSNGLNITKNQKDGIYSSNTDIVFGSYLGSDGDYGDTYIQMQNSKGEWINLEDSIDKLNATDITKDSKIQIVMNFGEIEANKDEMNTLVTINHEFSLHASPYLKLIEQLRSGKKTGADFVNEWKEVSKEGGYNNGIKQHSDHAKRLNVFYSKLAEQVSKQLKESEKKDFNRLTNEDIDAYKNIGG